MTHVILLEPVDNLGEAGAQVRVRPGYARNFLIPRGLALPATSANQAELNARLEQRARVLAERKGDAERLKELIEAYKAEMTPTPSAQSEPVQSEVAQAEAQAESASTDADATGDAVSAEAETDATVAEASVTEAAEAVNPNDAEVVEAPAHAIVIPVRAGESRIYGSVGKQDIAEAIEKQFEIQIDRRKLLLAQPIKELGHYVVTYRPHPEVPIEIDISVVANEA